MNSYIKASLQLLELKKQLGGKCIDCGCTDLFKLEIKQHLIELNLLQV